MAIMSKQNGKLVERNTVFFIILFPNFHMLGFVFQLEIVKFSIFLKAKNIVYIIYIIYMVNSTYE